jgi:hypothetical protein
MAVTVTSRISDGPVLVIRGRISTVWPSCISGSRKDYAWKRPTPPYSTSAKVIRDLDLQYGEAGHECCTAAP